MEKIKKIKKINHLQNLYLFFGILLTTLSTIIIICSTYLLIQIIIKPNTPPTVFGVNVQIVMTDDMSGKNVGHVENGDLVLIKKVEIEDIEKQNVIAYIDNGNILISRVIDIKADRNKFSVCADNTETGYLINDNQILGIITQKVSFVGEFLYFTQSEIGIIIFILVPSLILIIDFVCNIANKKKKETNTQNDLKEEKDIEFLQQKCTNIIIEKPVTIKLMKKSTIINNEANIPKKVVVSNDELNKKDKSK